MSLTTVAFLSMHLAAPGPAGWAASPAPNSGPEVARSRAPDPDTPDREMLETKLKQILARPDFRRAMRGSGHDPRNVGQWLLLRVRRFLGRLGGLHQTNYGLFLAAVAIGLVLLVAILTHIAYTFIQALRPMPRRTGDAHAARSARLPDPSSLMRQAAEQTAQGDHRSAIRSLYLALVHSLQMSGVLPRTASQTNWEQLAQLADRPSLAATVRPFTQAFDEKWYGGRPADARDVARCREWLEQALREVETG
jgi:hypothetical protein